MLKSNQGNITRRILYAQAVFGEEEKKAVLESMNNKWLASGGAQSMLVSLDRIASQKTLAEVASKRFPVSTPQKALNLLKGFAREPLSPLRTVSEFGEKGTRVGAFGRALKSGASELEAAFESRELTLDFARIGNSTKAVNQIIAFFNANVQGTDKLIRTFKEQPVKATLKATLGLTIPSVSLWFLNHENPRYQELPQWQKDLFWIVIPNDKSPIIRIPKPFTLGAVFATIPEHLLQWTLENDPDALSSSVDSLIAGSTPGLIPTAMLPIIENTANYSFFRDRPIVSQSLQNLPPELQSSTYTTETAKEIGKLIKTSPAKLENLVNGYFGGLGRYVLETSDWILKQGGIVSPPPEPAKELSEQPVIRAFIAREPIGSQSESMNQFYEIFAKAEQSEAAARKLANDGDIEGSVKYMEDHKEVLYVKSLRKVAKDFSNLREQRELVLNSKTMSPETKKIAIREIDTLMTEYAKQVLTLIKTAQ